MPARRPRTLLPAARKGLQLRFEEQKVHKGRRRKSSYCRLAGRRLCSTPLAKAYGFVSWSKIFTKGGGENRVIAGSPAADFAPRRPQRLTASFGGARSSHKAAAKIVILPARRPRTLLPAARKGLRLRIGEQNLHTKRRRKSLYCWLAGRRLCSPPPAKAYGFRSGEQKVHTRRRRKSSYCRRPGRRLCSPPPAKAYGFVRGSKIFTQGGGGNRFIAGSPAVDFAPRRLQRLTVPFRGAKSSHKAAAKIVLLPARRPPTLLPAARKGLRLRFGEQKVHTGRRRKAPY